MSVSRNFTFSVFLQPTHEVFLLTICGRNYHDCDLQRIFFFLKSSELNFNLFKASKSEINATTFKYIQLMMHSELIMSFDAEVHWHSHNLKCQNWFLDALWKKDFYTWAGFVDLPTTINNLWKKRVMLTEMIEQKWKRGKEIEKFSL